MAVRIRSKLSVALGHIKIFLIDALVSFVFAWLFMGIVYIIVAFADMSWWNPPAPIWRLALGVAVVHALWHSTMQRLKNK